VIASDADWVPAQIRFTAAGPLVDWCHLGDLRFTDPFFVQTINRAMAHPFNLLFRRSTPLAGLAEPDAFDLRPAGLIFHMTRCGSTLIAQMLAALPANLVLCEPPPIDRILRGHVAGVSPDLLVRWLRAMVGALGRRRHADERDLFIKLDGWHVLLAPLFRRAFPGVPWAFVYREPVEVLAPMAQRFPAEIEPALVGLTWPEVAAMPVERYCAAILQCLCGAAIAHYREGGGLLIEYRELPEAVCSRLLDHFGMRYGAAELARMREVACFDAKEPARRYSDDSEAKRRAASAEVRDLAATMLAPLHAQLDALRAQSGLDARSPGNRDEGELRPGKSALES
jgi:hypothetical protein